MLLSQSATQHQTVYLSVQTITEKKEASHEELPQIVRLLSIFQPKSCCIDCTFNIFSIDKGCLIFVGHKQKNKFHNYFQHLL